MESEKMAGVRLLLQKIKLYESYKKLIDGGRILDIRIQNTDADITNFFYRDKMEDDFDDSKEELNKIFSHTQTRLKEFIEEQIDLIINEIDNI